MEIFDFLTPSLTWNHRTAVAAGSSEYIDAINYEYIENFIHINQHGSSVDTDEELYFFNYIVNNFFGPSACDLHANNALNVLDYENNTEMLKFAFTEITHVLAMVEPDFLRVVVCTVLQSRVYYGLTHDCLFSFDVKVGRVPIF